MLFVRIRQQNFVVDMNCEYAKNAAFPEKPEVTSNPGSPIHGVLVLDKPEGITSFGLVAKVKKLLNIKKVGHCGTLDPFATGVMILCLNQATRIVDQLLVQDKAYRFTLRFGVETDTLDRTGQVIRVYEGSPPSEDELMMRVKGFLGTHQQRVPRYAAVKIQGKRLYELSRKGIEVDLPSREVQIQRLELISYRWPEAVLEAECSKGTYIRQLASDLGTQLGCGAHVTQLRRLRSGSFGIECAISLDAFPERSPCSFWEKKLITMNEALPHLPGIVVTNKRIVKRIQEGTLDSDWENEHRDHFAVSNVPVKVLAPDNHLVALWWPHADGREQRRLRVFQSVR
jgi:tRNA pseudouridine55 synthase